MELDILDGWGLQSTNSNFVATLEKLQYP
jgi:hypothetical protein